MKEVLALVEKKKQEFAQLPLFEYMRDKSIDPCQRLAFAPCITPFVMNIWEVNKYVLREEPTSNRIQALINKHTYEDDHHYLWFLEDIEKLGFNHSMKFSDALKFIWGEETKETRQICNRLTAYTFQADPLLKLAVIEVIEATGNVVLSRTTEVAKELQKTTNKEYRYFGEHHLAVETGHTTGTDDIEQFIENLELTEETQEKACELVEKVFDAFTRAINEFLVYAKRHSYKQPFTEIYEIEQARIAV